MVLNQWHLLNVLVLLHLVAGTRVKLNNGGFEDVVIAINPGLPEDNKIIDNIKEMVTEASSYLFNASQQRFYFKTIKVVIPLTWTPKTEYKRVTTESYENADVIVADPYLKYGDDPYTLQYGGCGEQGRYIHFTSNFLTNDSLHDVYGSRGRVFVHEWAHLRWGVFDEYNNDAPFYTTGTNKAEATRCSAAITGQYRIQTTPGSTRKCKIDHRSQLYEAGCQFIPDKVQTTPVSIMYAQSIASVTQFCDKSNHNINAANMQNKLCNYRSTWEVIMNSTDFASSSPINTPFLDPTIVLMQTRDRALCLVLDVSGSMRDNDRLLRLRQAAEIFLLQIIETGSWVGIVTFNSAATIQTGLQHIVSDAVRQTLTTYLPTSAGGGTRICAGVEKGFQVFLQKYPSTEGCEIVLLTDGEDKTISSCFTNVANSGSVIHTIALGPSAAKELEMLADMTGGLKFSATDRLDSNGLIDVFSAIPSGSGNTSQQSIQLESKGESINPNQWLDGIVSIDKTVGNDTFFVVTWSLSTYPPGIFLTDPKGRRYTQANFVIDKTNIRTARLQIPGTALAGNWVYSILNTHSTAQVISVTATTRAASASVPPVMVKSYVSKDTNSYPSPIIIYAEVSQGFLPVIGANVTAAVESASGQTEELELLDDGWGADIIMYDGIYSRYFVAFKENGRYNIKVRIQGQNETVRRTRRQSLSLYIPGYVENGEIKMNALRPEVSEEEIQADIEDFSRTTSGGSFAMSGVPAGNLKDVFPPCAITDLEVEPVDEGEFLLSWTAPGDDYDSGKAERYEIKMSESLLELRYNFTNATSLNTSNLIPEIAGVKQYFQYKPENVTKENDTILYFAIRAIDNSNNIGQASNIARAVLLATLPTTPSPATSDHHTTFPAETNDAHNGLNTVAIVLIIVCVAAVIICAIVGITVCLLCKKKTRTL
ncbi:calcium-activated chloride channel regulator 4 [Pogona vitticeps]